MRLYVTFKKSIVKWKDKMLVSIIVPVYKAEDYLDECVNSVLNQTYKNIELLLIDDGSPDNSGKLCDEIAERDERVKVFHKENGGTHTARNLGIEKSSGTYLMFMDPDDWLDIDTVENLVNKIQQDDLDVIRFNFIKEFGNYSKKKENTFLQEKIYRNRECKEICRQSVGLIFQELKHPENLNFLASVCFNIYKKSRIVENNLSFYSIRELGTFSDGLFNIEFYMHCDSFLFIDRGFYHYRKTNVGSATSNYRESFLEKQNFLFSKIQDLIENSDIENIALACKNRIAIGVMELCLNVLKSKHSFSNRYKEIKEILQNKTQKEALQRFDISYFPLKWKIYYCFIKTHFTPGVYMMTYAIKKLKNRG